MNIIKTTALAVIKRPFILVLIGILMLAAAVFNAFIPIMAMIIGILNMTGGGLFDSALSILQLLIDPSNLPAILITLAILTIIFSLMAGLLLPGYLMIVEDSLKRGEKTVGLFSNGIKTYFFKFFLMTLNASLFTVLFALFLLIAAVPAIIVTRAVITSKPELMIAAVFIDILTIGVFFICLSFFKAYIFMWYTAAAKGEKHPFKVGKSIADRQFWSLATRLLGFDLVFGVAFYLIYTSEIQLLRYVLGWVFATAFFTTLTVFIVKTYRDSSQKRDVL